MRRYLKAHRRELGPQATIVLGIEASGAGPPVWWRSDGRLVPIRYTRRLRELAETAADGLAAPHRSRGGTPALPARARRLTAIAIGTVDDTDQPDETALDDLQQFALRLIHAIDDELDSHPAADEPEPAPTPA